MVPAQLVAEAVAVLADSGAKAFDLPDKRIAIEIGKIFVHVVLLMAAPVLMNVTVHKRHEQKANMIR